MSKDYKDQTKFKNNELLLIGYDPTKLTNEELLKIVGNNEYSLEAFYSCTKELIKRIPDNSSDLAIINKQDLSRRCNDVMRTANLNPNNAEHLAPSLRAGIAKDLKTMPYQTPSSQLRNPKMVGGIIESKTQPNILG